MIGSTSDRPGLLSNLVRSGMTDAQAEAVADVAVAVADQALDTVRAELARWNALATIILTVLIGASAFLMFVAALVI